MSLDDYLPTAPASAREDIRETWRALEPLLAPLLAARPDGPGTLMRVWAASDFVRLTCERRPTLLPELWGSGDLDRPYAPGVLRERLARAAADAVDEAALKRALRGQRAREFVRIAWRDLVGDATLEEVMETLSEFADAAVDTALTWVRTHIEQKTGAPIGEHSGAPVPFIVLGMGKLGGYELNFSSDIDLIFAYTEEGETAAGLSNHEFFTRLGRGLIAALNDATEDGIVFRVDMRLRPNGASGPLALSCDAMEHYYQAHGREWERYALIKARPVAGDRAEGDALLGRLKPFVYRRYLDYGAIDSIRELKAMIDREVARKGLANNVKLGPGGIREIEFIGQSLQLVRGGREPDLRQRRIQQVLLLLAQRRYLTAQAVDELREAYVFLRRLEHRLQMRGDRQTHTLPADEDERARIALAMNQPDWPSCETQLRRHMRKVHGHFEQAFVAPQGEAPAAAQQGLVGVWLETLDAESAGQTLQAAGYADAAATQALLRGLREGAAYDALSAQARTRIDRLMPLLLGAAALTPAPLTTLARVIKLIEAIGRRSAYMALLIENPMALSQLIKLCGASDWIANWLAQHPVLLDELLDPRALYTPLPKAALADELRARLAHLAEDDLEAQMEAMREFRHGHVLRVAAADIGPGLSPERVGAHLCEIAEVVLAQCLALAHAALIARHGHPSGVEAGRTGFVIVGYGKLGSLELGYSSDLDLSFIYDPAAEGGTTDGAKPVPNEVFFARLGQRVIHHLSTRTPAGVLYPVDMRLRPSGQSGPLVTHLEAFRKYQLTKAWAWEHQALVRARAVAGDADLAAGFAAVRREVLCQRRDPAKLRAEVQEMRARMRAAQPPHAAGLFDLKHDAGGIVDIEFVVQYAALRWAADHPAVVDDTDNIHILRALARAGRLDEARVAMLADAYRRYLSLEQRLKLMDNRPLVERAELGDNPDAIVRIWQEFFEEN